MRNTLFLMLIVYIFTTKCDAQEISIAEIVDKISKKNSNKNAVSKNINSPSFICCILPCIDSGNDNDVYDVKFDDNNQIVEICWKLNDSQRLVFLPHYIDDYILFEVECYFSGLLYRQLSGILVAHLHSNRLFYLKVDSIIKFPLPSGEPFMSNLQIQEIFLLGDDLFPQQSFRVYENIIVSKSDFTYNNYLITENFQLLEQNYVSDKKLFLTNFSFLELFKLFYEKHPGTIEKEIIHQRPLNVPLWAPYKIKCRTR